MKNKVNLIISGSILLILVHAQLNVSDTFSFLGLSALVGILPLTKNKWWHYSILALLASIITFALNPPQSAVAEALGTIVPIGSAGFVIATITVTSMTITLVAQTSMVWFGPLVKKLFRTNP